MKPLRAWAIVNKETGEIANLDIGGDYICIYATRKMAREMRRGDYDPSDYTIKPVAIIEVGLK